MNDSTLDMIRRALERGYTNEQVREFLDLAGIVGGPAAFPDAPAPPGTRRKQARASIQVPAGSIDTGTRMVRPGPMGAVRNFVKPNITRTVYALSKSADTPAKLDKLGITGNQRIVADFVGKHADGADSRMMRASILKHKLRDDGTNKAIESAVHALTTRKPAVLDRYDRDNGE